MIYLKWALLAVADLVLLPVALFIAAPLVSLFTRPMAYKDDASYTWGWIFGTYDNPPQGDKGYVEKHAFFPNELTGWKGYINRVTWMCRNNLYGLAKIAGITWKESMVGVCKGNPDISDKYGIPGWYSVKLFDGQKLVGFEFYCVLPWSKTRDLRARLGWKINTSKFKEYGFAQFVCTANPFDGYNTSKR